MSVYPITIPQRFTGLSSDTKPTTGLAYGATFFESDTRNEYMYNGSSWVSSIPNYNMATALSSDTDSVNVGKMGHGTTVTALSAVSATTTSSEISVGAAGYKHVKIELTGASFSSGNFAVTFTGAETSGSTFGAIYKLKSDLSAFATVPSITISSNVVVTYIIENIGVNYLKVVGTRTTDGTLTAKVTPFN